MFRGTGLLAAALVVAAAFASVSVASAAPVSASASAPYCGIRWGSQPKTATTAASLRVLTNIRAGRHACFDRLVFDVRGGSVTWYRVAYVTDVITAGGSSVPLRGGAKLAVDLHAAPKGVAGAPAYGCTWCAEIANVSGYQTFRQVSGGGSYRNTTLVGLGVRARLPFRVFQLPGRFVVDVAHRW